MYICRNFKTKQLDMKTTNKFLLAILAISTLTLTSCNKDDDDNANPTPVESNIVELAQNNGFNSLATALTITELVDDLQGEGPFTVFAPTDQAFSNLLTEIGQTDIYDIPKDILKEVLLYHVVPLNVPSKSISDGEVATLQGSNIMISTMDGIKINNASVIMPYDVTASNGVIHTVDQVLVPESVAQFVNTILEPAFFNKNFSKLVMAASKADLITTILETPELTIFAPTNDAFEASGINPETIDAETLTAVLTYHVVPSKVMSSQIPSETATVNGNKLHFSVLNNVSYINGNTQITGVDIESGSGVVHVIDKVVIPPSGNLVETTIALTSDGEFTSLVAALQRTANEGTADQNLLTILSSNGPFTVFAPTNAAFQQLIESNSEWNSLNDIPLETLIAVLTYHVVPAKAFDKDLPAAIDSNGQLPTAQGQKLTIDLNNLTINQTSNIVAVNTNATNGVIHVINSVLLPN